MWRRDTCTDTLGLQVNAKNFGRQSDVEGCTKLECVFFLMNLTFFFKEKWLLFNHFMQKKFQQHLPFDIIEHQRMYRY